MSRHWNLMNTPLRLHGRVEMKNRVDQFNYSSGTVGAPSRRVSIRETIDPLQSESIIHHIPKEISSLLKSNNLKKKKFLRKLDPTKVNILAN